MITHFRLNVSLPRPNYDLIMGSWGLCGQEPTKNFIRKIKEAYEINKIMNNVVVNNQI